MAALTSHHTIMIIILIYWGFYFLEVPCEKSGVSDRSLDLEVLGDLSGTLLMHK